MIENADSDRETVLRNMQSQLGVLTSLCVSAQEQSRMANDRVQTYFAQNIQNVRTIEQLLEGVQARNSEQIERSLQVIADTKQECDGAGIVPSQTAEQGTNGKNARWRHELRSAPVGDGGAASYVTHGPCDE